MVSVGDDALNQDLVDQGAIGQLVGKFLFYSGKIFISLHHSTLRNESGKLPFPKRGTEFSGLQNLLLCCIVLWFRY